MIRDTSIRPSEGLKNVRYEIRGALSRRAIELERQGYEIISLNIGNPGAYGFRTPEILRLALVQNLPQAEGYAYQKGIYQAREGHPAAAAESRHPRWHHRNDLRGQRDFRAHRPDTARTAQRWR